LQCKKVSFNSTLLTCFKIKRAIEACKGMIYLEEMKIIHRDLAARNLLVDGDNIVKVVSISNYCLLFSF
jgi:serine/threonine protein kinase